MLKKDIKEENMTSFVMKTAWEADRIESILKKIRDM